MKSISDLLFLLCLAGMSTSYSIGWFYIYGSFSYFDCLVPVILFSYFLRFSSKKIHFDHIIIILASISFLTGVSVFISLVSSALPDANPSYFFRSLLFMMVYFLVRNWPVSTEKVLIAVFVGMFASTLISLFAWSTAPRYFAFTNIPMMHSLDNSLGIIVNRNQVGFCSSFCFIISFYAFIFRDLVPRWVSLSATVFLFIFSLLTFSKGTWLIITIGVILILLIRFNFYKNLLVYLSLLLAFFVVNPFPDLTESILLRFQNSAQTNDYRLQYIMDAIAIGLENPIFGVGPGNYRFISKAPEFTHSVDPHNVFLQMFSELGLIVTCLVISLYLSGIIQNMVQLRGKKQKSLVFIFMTSLLIDSFISGLSFSSKYLYIMLGVSTLLNKDTSENLWNALHKKKFPLRVFK